MSRVALIVAMVVGLGVSLAYTQGPSAKVQPNAVIFMEESEFGQALSAAILKKKVPVIVTTNKEKAQFFVAETSAATKEGAAERVTKVIAFGAFAGSGKTYEASVALTNPEGVIVFAHNTRKSNIRSAAEDVANKLKDHITKR